MKTKIKIIFARLIVIINVEVGSRLITTVEAYSN